MAAMKWRSQRRRSCYGVANDTDEEEEGVSRWEWLIGNIVKAVMGVDAVAAAKGDGHEKKEEKKVWERR